MAENRDHIHRQNSEPNSRPWQVDWKNPTWTSFEQSSDKKTAKGTVVDISAAQVLAAELSKEVPELCELLGIDPDENDNQWLLTVTLLDPSGKSAYHPVATEVLLELADCDNEKIVYSRSLIWPEVMEASMHEQGQKTSVLLEFGSLMWPWPRGNDDADNAIGQSRPKRGLVAAVLCRQPLRKEAKEEEALAVIMSMTIGLDASRDLGENVGLDKGPATSLGASDGLVMNSHDEESDRVWDSIEEPIEPLCLAGVSSEGLICVYSIWSLLSTSDSNSGTEKESSAGSMRLSEEQAMTSWLLGADLFENLESTWLPLSQPRTTISLSILNDARSTFHHSDYNIGDDDSSRFKSSSHGAGKVGLTAWNPWIETSTLRHRTVLNRVTSIHVVSSNYPFLVLLGQGVRFMGHKTAPESSRVGKSVAFEKEVAASDQGKNEEEWWKVQDEPDSSTSKFKAEKTAQQQDLEYDEVESGVSTTGGFIAFCSMASWVESKTLFLDFVPLSVTFIERWHGMQLLLCMGNERAVVIRLDSIPAPVLVGMDEDLEAMFGNDEGYPTPPGQHPTLHVSRYAVLPVDLPLPLLGSQSATIGRRILSADATTVPSLLQFYAESDGTFQKEMGLLAVLKFVGISGKGVILTSTQNNAVAQLPARRIDDSGRPLLESSWGHLDQGWSLFGTGNHTFFLCWEGATATRGVAFIQELVDSPAHVQSVRSTARVLLLSNSRNRASHDRASLRSVVLSEGGALEDLTARVRKSTVDSIHGPLSVVDSPDDLTLDESTILETEFEISGPKNQERTERLLRRISSWTKLEDTEGSRGNLACKIPVIALRSLVTDDTSENLRLHIFKMRQVVIENGSGSPFSQVLCWLSQKEDYFTAASIALDMLQDPDTLYHLWKHAEKIDEEDEQSKLHGLLDGILPINITERAKQTRGSTTLRQLADMTVGCLIKGGLAMSRTLSRFLHFNKQYDPERASLMLVASAISALSRDPKAVASVMGSKGSKTHDYSIPKILWPVECLLEIAVERDYIHSTLNLLNTNIPDELRCRPRPTSGDIVLSVPDLEVTTALVTMIVSKGSTCVDLLLDLPNDTGSLTFWASLDHVAQQTLALICIDGRYPMLIHEEIREWTRRQLQGGMDKDNHIGPSSLRTEWLQEVVPACLLNAGCNLSDFVFEPSSATMIPSNSENSADWSNFELHGDDGLYQLKLQITETRVALEPSPGSSGLDFDILISALLLLESRHAPWNENEFRCVSTQGLLDAACHLAGRPRSKTETTRFSLDPATLMEQCTRYENVRAGANLVGGKNGFVLSCCHVLMMVLQIPVEKAELFFLEDKIDSSLVVPKEESSLDPPRAFQLTDSHRHLLWLLDECVLSVRTFGDFEVGLNPQGRVDPVFAARSIFRAWLCLTDSCKQSASHWISEWLRTRLGLPKQGSSVHRLACAAMVRALLWPGSDENEISSVGDMADQRLGHLLEMDEYFLIELAQASCGLVESIPPPVAAGLINLRDAVAAVDFPRPLTSIEIHAKFDR